MIRRFNYTNRLKIDRNRIDISLFKDRDGKYFRAKINLEGLEMPPQAKIYIEANYKGVYQRFAFGTIAHFKEPESTRLNELPETELAYFDIAIVDEAGKVGLLLGSAKGIVVSTDGSPNDRISLLPVNPVDLKNQFWKLTFDSGDEGRPVLEINKNIPDILEMARNDVKFISLVYPAAFRSVLIKLLLEQDDFDAEEGTWIADWLKFTIAVLGIKNQPDTKSDNDELTPEQEVWVDDCVNEYCKKLQLFEKFTAQ
ncbi:hypothetical protein [Sediminibacterium sp.]|uniref:hypothetical protein n=1 Tax=Sediminibacterium sp. TaxID=1917865 RepID=UPI0025ED433E|nr:hypothetical protein [Sediminibacterium sp.]MBW0176668.1 hypothetical protein [Sediminibacterium sp.]